MRMAYVAALVCGSLVIGCGGDDDEKSNADRYDGEEAEVAAVIDDFSEAGHDGNGPRVCDEIFAEDLKRNIESEAGQSCATEVEQNLPEGEYELEVDSVDLNGASATVTVTDQDDNRSVLVMTKNGEDWEVFRVRPAM